MTFWSNRKWISYSQIMNLGYQCQFSNFLDKGSIEVFGAFGSSLKLWNLSKSISQIHSGMIFHYSFIMLISVLCSKLIHCV